MSSKTAVQFCIVPRSELAASQKSRMLELLTQHFDGITPEQFERDLSEKNLVLLLQREESLVGFSTLCSYTTKFEGTRTNVIYSGDTIVAPEAWGTTALPRAWVAGVNTLRATLPGGRCFWLLLTSGFRTYRFLPVFWRDFFPRFDTATPPEAQRMMDQLARERFGTRYDPCRGIVRFANPQRLRPELKEVPTGRRSNPHVAFFLSRNPACAWGDELVCLTEICAGNLTAAGKRMMPPPFHATHSDNR